MAATTVPIFNVAAQKFEQHPIEVKPTTTTTTPLSSTVRRAKAETKQKMKNLSKQKIVSAEMIPGHRGDGNIDDLVNFINAPSTNTNGKSKKTAKN